MKTRLVLPLLGFVCLLMASQVTSQAGKVEPGCQLGDMLPTDPVPFPDIEKLAIESYQMTVEYTLPKVKQTDYYTEFYDIVMRMGRVDSHQMGENRQFIYRTDTSEAWDLKGDKCQRINITGTPEMFRDYQMNWEYTSPDDDSLRTIGPSAMFKNAYDRWNHPTKKRTMAYLGELHGPIRGIRAQAWRWCETNTTSVDYFFTAVNSTDNAYGLDSLNIIPLRVSYNDERGGEDKDLVEQYYDIMTFQPYISLGYHPFQVPKGKNCGRNNVPDAPKLPDFSDKNLLFSAEVLYRKRSVKDDEDVSSYYSTFMFALDRESKTLSYFYSKWNSTKPEDDKTADDTLSAPEYIVFDMEYNYAYKVNYETGRCSISRDKSFIPAYKFPGNAGSIALTDPYVLFPNNELSYLTEGTERGLVVDIFEASIDDYVLSSETMVKRAIFTHSYLQKNEILDNNIAIKNAPTQIEMHLFQTEEYEEIVTFNFFGFTTKLPEKRLLFDVTRCFKNDDDYSWLTLGFETGADKLPDLSEVPVSDIQSNIMSYLDIDANLKPTRVPIVLVDVTDELYVTLLLLEKPPLQLDFIEQADKTIDTNDVLGLADYNTCATKCLEEKSDCWGFSLCGGQCFFGTQSSRDVTDKKGCTLHERYNNGTFLRSKDLVIKDIENQVVQGNVKLNLYIKDTEISLKATSVQVMDPAEDDTTFEKMGNQLNPRMRVVKTGVKLKKGDEVKNMGKLMFSECQKLCLDFKDCETLSYCMIDSDCVLSTKYGDEIKDTDMVNDTVCELVTRKYADNFDRSPGLFLAVEASSTLNLGDTEDCARACLKETKFKCLSFDHCPREKDGQCRLHKIHFLNKKAKKESLDAKPTCGHYTRKYSTEFKKHINSKIVGSKVPPITNLTLEECAKSCMEYGRGDCFGFDFCQDSTMYATSCLLIDSDPSRLESIYSSTCTNFQRGEEQYAPRPYSNAYAGGIGFLCFVVGGVVGAIVVFIIAYIRVNRR